MPNPVNFLNPRAVNAERERAAGLQPTPAAPPKPAASGPIRFGKPFTQADREHQRKALTVKLRELAARDAEARQ
jgi:hypothetical protein